MTTAYVLSGGAALGSVQVGMLQALHDAGIRPDLVVGTSAGAVNAAWVAGDPEGRRLDELENLWLNLRRTDIYNALPSALLGLTGRRSGLLDHNPLRRLLNRHLPFDNLEDAALPLHVIVSDVLTARDVRLSTGSSVEAVLASTAVPGVFPPVEIDGRLYMDGGVVNNAAISHAVDLEATTIWVLPTGWSCSLAEPPKGAVGMAMQGLTALVQHRLADDVVHFREMVDIRVVPPPCPIEVGPADLSQAAHLISSGRSTASAWLETQDDTGVHLLLPHDHAM